MEKIEQFFSRKEFETWHSYEGNKVSNRIALVYNLNTYNIKKSIRLRIKVIFWEN